ncbi:hypothetical protein HK098_002563 [Nowakowskiella sp. JEL0407]|nr:hypothetical protein HK098_002563 [Nowakowskiella sp. JEL0407]
MAYMLMGAFTFQNADLISFYLTAEKLISTLSLKKEKHHYTLSAEKFTINWRACFCEEQRIRTFLMPCVVLCLFIAPFLKVSSAQKCLLNNDPPSHVAFFKIIVQLTPRPKFGDIYQSLALIRLQKMRLEIRLSFIVRENPKSARSHFAVTVRAQKMVDTLLKDGSGCQH